MWIEKSQTSTDIDDCKLFKLLKYNQEVEWKSLERFGQHSNILAGAMIALLATGGAALAASRDEVKIVAFFVPLFVVYLRNFCIKTLDRYYRQFLEAVVYTAKIEFLLGLHRPIWPVNRSPEIDTEPPFLFEKDKTIDVDRRLKACINKDLPQSSGKWVYSFLSKGHNEIVWSLFRAIFVGSCLIPILAVIVFWDFKNYFSFSVAELKTNILPLCGACASIWIARLVYMKHSKEIDKKREDESKIQL